MKMHSDCEKFVLDTLLSPLVADIHKIPRDVGADGGFKIGSVCEEDPETLAKDEQPVHDLERLRCSQLPVEFQKPIWFRLLVHKCRRSSPLILQFNSQTPSCVGYMSV